SAVTVEVAVAESFSSAGSTIDDVADAVIVIDEPATAAGSAATSTLIVVDSPPARLAIEHPMMPASPTAGLVHPAGAGPTSWASCWKVVPGGRVSVSTTFVAVVGPLLLTLTV